MDLEILIQRNTSQKREVSFDISYAESKKMIQMNLFTKEKSRHRYRKHTYSY